MRFGPSGIVRLVSLFVERPAAVRAALVCRPFSLTSFRMVDDLRRQCVRPATVVDVGGNVGQFARAALHLLRPRVVHVFEPLPQAVAELRSHFASEPQVIIHPVALGASRGELTLHVNAHSPASSLLPLGSRHREALPGATTVAEEQVHVRTHAR